VQLYLCFKAIAASAKRLVGGPIDDAAQRAGCASARSSSLLATKVGNPALSLQVVIRAARERPEVLPDLPLPPSAVHRLLIHPVRPHQPVCRTPSNRR
jgi:hypothetical protein